MNVIEEMRGKKKTEKNKQTLDHHSNNWRQQDSQWMLKLVVKSEKRNKYLYSLKESPQDTHWLQREK